MASGGQPPHPDPIGLPAKAGLRLLGLNIPDINRYPIGLPAKAGLRLSER